MAQLTVVMEFSCPGCTLQGMVRLPLPPEALLVGCGDREWLVCPHCRRELGRESWRLLAWEVTRAATPA